jgi:predicted DNA-binding protein
MHPKRPRRIMTPVYLDPEKKAAITQLSKATRVPAAVYLREAVDDLLNKYKKQLRRL